MYAVSKGKNEREYCFIGSKDLQKINSEIIIDYLEKHVTIRKPE